MNILIRKRQIVMAGLVLTLSAAVFVNWYFTKPEMPLEKETTVKSQQQANLGDAKYVNSDNSEDLFAEAKLKRTNTHDEIAEELNDIIKDSESDAEAIKSASEKLNKLADNMKHETDLENLIKAKISADSLVILNGDKAEIIVKGEQNDTSTLIITELIMKQSGIHAKNITIIEAK